jgi:hypothetical protein
MLFSVENSTFTKEALVQHLEKPWQEGLKAGEQFIKQCPYPGNSLEARNWRNGWLEGAAKCLGITLDSEALRKTAPERAVDSEPCHVD